jgi:hypothetical protein
MSIFTPDFLGNLFKLIARSSCKHHICAFLGESKCNAAADTSSGTRYEGNFVFEFRGKLPGSNGIRTSLSLPVSRGRQRNRQRFRPGNDRSGVD